MACPLTNLILEGGGVKGIAYADAMEGLKGKRIPGNVKRDGGRV